MSKSSRIIDILHLGILNSISKIGLSVQIPLKKFDQFREDSILSPGFADCKNQKNRMKAFRLTGFPF
ncbi:hypothetical protein [Leptospira borgpetersenii]|uniref:Uncharacterized protein n=1 Tax=Leptospira borgpetersenii serovar Hardjo-bovis str. Sponselee TaxID=1303729 RepID=M6BQE3_LEPBO|nr:hypothetical protein [Leptospira borgpetersenii]AMX57119.1 hypothetical protein LBK6_01515 [Leptospira borgpetersenii serovar Hardjo]AMX60350.1 hypothetical protein LBK9_01515 [Leptospira borgpetersenii serovar Hardjo]AMX63597.1 hypothetical protein LBK30_01530 [Leptospira borgpetersenii serovar Hardjo]AMX66836.1 hypothetical protein LBHA_01530 [Leptospira borgpetersenii serovar Hardjo]AMX72469.1 hypothetical protein LBHB_14965 [Leptospira borgpetersenii serovar Hardjo]